MGFKTETKLRQELAKAWQLVDSYKKDAMRYRWLREHSTQPMEPWSTHSEPASLDEAVDEAMRSNGTKLTGTPRNERNKSDDN